MDYSEAILEVKSLTKQIHEAALKGNFVLAQQLTDSLSFMVKELFDALGEQIV